jgi:hypothetical protein
MFLAEDLFEIIEEANQQLKAMILLGGINCGTAEILWRKVLRNIA